MYVIAKFSLSGCKEWMKKLEIESWPSMNTAVLRTVQAGAEAAETVLEVRSTRVRAEYTNLGVKIADTLFKFPQGEFSQNLFIRKLASHYSEGNYITKLMRLFHSKCKCPPQISDLFTSKMSYQAKEISESMGVWMGLVKFMVCCLPSRLIDGCIYLMYFLQMFCRFPFFCSISISHSAARKENKSAQTAQCSCVCAWRRTDAKNRSHCVLAIAPVVADIFI